jgi:hypothetical protein
VREISPFFIIWIFINKNCFMKQIFEILQEERDRILNIHESATKNQYLNTLIVEEENLTKSRNYGNGIINRGGNLVGDKNYFIVQNTTAAENPKGGSGLQFFKGTKFVGGSEGYLKTAKPVTVQFPGYFGEVGTKNAKGTILFNCNSKLLIVKNIDSNALKNYGYENSKNTYDLSADSSGYLTLGGLRAVCDNIKEGVKPKAETNTGTEVVKQGTEVVKQGTDSSSNNKYPLTSDHVLYASNNKAVLKVLKNTTISFYPDKNGAGGSAQFIEGDKRKINVWFNCGTGKFLAKNVLPVLDPTTNKTIPAGQKTFTYYTDKPFKEFLQKKCERLKKGSNSGDSSNVGTDSAGLGNSTGNSTGGSVVTKPNDTALDTILQKISGAATQKPGEVKQAPQTWEG